jgi:ubiquinol-cytochrome c reductase cytochrome b subunit
VLWRQKHTQFRGPGRKEHNVVGSRLWPGYAVKSVGLFAFVVAVIALLGGLVQINPVWLYGPFKPAAVSTAAQPDWYLGWAEGAIRLFPPWYFTVFGHPVPEVFWPAIVLPAVTFAIIYAWPFLEARRTGDHEEHHLLDRPSDRPVHTALGAAALAFYSVLTVAGGQDVIAQHLHVHIATMTTVLRIAVFVVPVLVGLITWKVARDLRGARAQAAEAAEDDPVTEQAEQARQPG